MKSIFNNLAPIRFSIFIILVISGYFLDEKFQTFTFLPIALIIEGLLILKYKAFYFYDVFEGYNLPNIYSNTSTTVSDNIKFPGKYSIYWATIFILLGVISISLYFINGVTLAILFS